MIVMVLADEEFDELCFEFGIELDEVVWKTWCEGIVMCVVDF